MPGGFTATGMDLIVKTSGVARKRSYGNEKRDFGEDGLMIRRRSSNNAPLINDPLVNAPPIKVAGRKFHWLQKS
ncbi:hypothetical protein A7J67_16620 [Achromobacter xylosoxidans]|nr:hypothetical protein A7J67_16620 [Achromobacter xylosoxidans]